MTLRHFLASATLMLAFMSKCQADPSSRYQDERPQLPAGIAIPDSHISRATLEKTYLLGRTACSPQESAATEGMTSIPFYTTYSNGQATRVGVVARSGAETYVCFRGTQNGADLITDFDFFPTNLKGHWDPGASGHQGIYAWYQRILHTQPSDLAGKTPETFGAPLTTSADSPDTLPTLEQALGAIGADPTNDTLIVTGFSLGGGVAPFFAYDASHTFGKVHLVPIAAPMVLNPEGVRNLERQLTPGHIMRISRDLDIVTGPVPGFQHAGPRIALPSLENPIAFVGKWALTLGIQGPRMLPSFLQETTFEILANHTQRAYVDRLKEKMTFTNFWRQFPQIPWPKK